MRPANSARSASLRWSVQAIDARSGWSPASSSTQGSRWDTTHMPATAPGSTPSAATICRTASTTPRSQSSGSFSAQPGRG